MPRHAQPETTLRDVYRAFFRHKGKAGGFFLLVMAAVVLAVVYLPNAYRSEGKLFVRLGRENTTLDPTASPGREPVIVVPPSREDEINSVVEILHSRSLLEKVVEAIGPAAILDHQGRGAPPADTPSNLARASVGGVAGPDAAARSAAKEGWLERLKLAEPLSDQERAVAKLKANLDVEPVRKSNVIVITYESHSPELSQAVVSRLIDFYLQEHIRLNRTSGACGFFGEQASRMRSALAEAQDRLRDMKNATGLAAPEKQRELIVGRISRMEDDLLHTSEETAAAETKVHGLKEKLKGLSGVQVTSQTSGVGNEGTDRMRERLYALELTEQEMLAKYTDQHPKMQQIRQQTAAARELLRREEGTRTQVTKGPDRTYEELQIELLREEPRLASLGSRAGALRTQLAGLRDELKVLNQNELRIAELQREAELREADYRKYAANLEQARIDQALENDRISNITVAEPATLERKPVRPRRALSLVLGLAVALAGGLGLALTAEFLDRSFRGPEDIERRLELPALVSIPRLNRRQLTHDSQTLLADLPWASGAERPPRLQALGLTSCYRGEGVSTLAAQLALTAAVRGHRRVLLVDANLARPSAHRTFSLDLQPGLAEVLADPERLSASIRASGVAGLSVLAAGAPQGSPGQALDSASLAGVLQRLRAEFDLLVFDLPPSGQEGSATRLASLLDGVVMVVEAERVRWEVAQRASELLRRADVRLLGAVLNKRRQHVPNWLYRTL